MNEEACDNCFDKSKCPNDRLCEIIVQPFAVNEGIPIVHPWACN